MTDSAVPDAGGRLPVVNTHVHFPPNFSAFSTVADAIGAAASEGARAVGISNFFDQQVYAVFAEQAQAAGIVPLYGLEFITLEPDLAAAGVRVNDPANPGRMYLCGKGIAPFARKSDAAARIAREIREGNDERATAMVAQLAAHFAASGLDTGLDAPRIAAAVAASAQVPVEWVSLQERHVAQAFQQALATLPREEREAVLTRAYGAPSGVDVDDAVALQGELRSRLIKVGTPGFVAEVPLSFADAYRYVLEMGGIPTYPTLADGVTPVCPFEDPAEHLAQQLVERGIHAAELIPIRNTSACVDAYVKAFTDAGIIVMGGTEHNTLDRIPIEVACVDGPVSDTARTAFWEATCVVAAHQHEVSQGRPGYVDASGARTHVPTAELVALGSTLIDPGASSRSAQGSPQQAEDEPRSEN
ncbi:MAG: hypothetical protein QM779_17080 [Propionicimonas sp.]|uniref:hypothetical protein n=1 Tax=Propionicimonas sp. TaxID=1955623 RepID=UPI003D0D5F2F